MPAAVKNIRWKCPQCGKSFWMKPYETKNKKYCSRACVNASMRVANPVRPVQSQKRALYGEKTCPTCNTVFDAKSKQQIYCSRECQQSALHERRRKHLPTIAHCEVCGKEFRPRVGQAGRFCSRQCNYDGQRGENAPHWQGGRHITREGYASVLAPDHPSAFGHGGYVKEHRLVMEQHLGRLLRPNETVHHRNGDRADNRIENLELWVRSHPAGQRVTDLVDWAKEILTMYEAEASQLVSAGG